MEILDNQVSPSSFFYVKKTALFCSLYQKLFVTLNGEKYGAFDLFFHLIITKINIYYGSETYYG